MESLQGQALKVCVAAVAIALAGLAGGACTQQQMQDSPFMSAPAAPTPIVGNDRAVFEPRTVAGGGANTELLCHARGNGTFAPLSVNANAVDGHLRHGDGRALGEAPGGFVFSSTCELVANIAGTWIGESITFDSNADPVCGRDLNEYRLTLTQSGSDVSGEVYWKILESFYPPDVGDQQTLPLTSGTVSGNTFTFSYGPAQLGLIATATFTSTAMTGTITLAGSSACDPNTFTLTRQ